MIEKLTEAQVNNIVRNVVSACKDIHKLNKTGYNYLYVCSGQIAHYDIQGFIQYYEEHSLIQSLIDNIEINQWRNFHKGEENYEYYHQKGQIYNMILKKIKKR